MNLYVLKGPNFSGRTQRLRDWVNLPRGVGADPAYSQSAYIGPTAADSLSGIAPTVAAEIDLMAADSEAAKQAKRAFEALGFGYCLAQNPFTLSGGEQVALAIIAATGARPRRLAIDCTLEQFSPDTRTNVLTYLAGLDGDLMIADNRLDEWHSGPVEELEAAPGSPVMHPETSLPIAGDPCEIEILDLSHAYVKGRPVLKDLNIKFEAGAQYLLRGPNGVGKSTLSKILCGLIKPTSGEVRVNGQPVQPWRTPGSFVSYAFQDPDLQLFSNSVFAQLSRTSDPTAVARRFGLEQHFNDHPLDLPFVLKKRLATASAIGRQNGFIILDEPTIGQDTSSSLDSRDFLVGTSGIMISHSSIYAGFPQIRLV